MENQTILEMLRIGWVAGFIGPSMICFSIGALFYYGKSHRGICLIIFATGLQLLLGGLNIEMRINDSQMMNVSFLTFVLTTICMLIGLQIELHSRPRPIRRTCYNFRVDSNSDPGLADDDVFSELDEYRNKRDQGLPR